VLHQGVNIQGAVVEMSNIFGTTPLKVQKPNSVEDAIDMGSVLRHLSQSKGRLEIVFQKNENPAYESLCLAFIKIPIYGAVINIIKSTIETDGSSVCPLSKGKLSVDSKDEMLYAFVGAIRIKNIDKVAEVLNVLLARMHTVLNSAVQISKRDDIGNVKTPFKRHSSMDGTRSYRSPSSQKTTSNKPKPYTFSRETK